MSGFYDSLQSWAVRHGVTPAALAELDWLLVEHATPSVETQDQRIQSETDAQSAITIEASKDGHRLLRNNSGAYSADRPPSPGTRWGLGNTSPKINKVFKSSDLIGLTHWGQFLAIEVKDPGWKFRKSDARAVGQLAFINFVRRMGGVGGFARNPEEYRAILAGQRPNES